MHLGRQPYNTNVWRDTFVCDRYGEDEILLWKGLGSGAHAAGPGGSLLKFSCQNSFKKWILTFDGAAMKVPRSEVSHDAGGALREHPIVPVKMQIEVVADAPIWDIGAEVSGHNWGKDHYQQSMRVVGGELIVNGVSRDLGEGLATRDHTRGPRDFNGLGSYAWIHGGFPGGRHFICMTLDPRDGWEQQQPIRMGLICDANGTHKAKIISTAIPKTKDGGAMKYTIQIEGPDGIETIEAEQQSRVLIAVSAPNYLMFGPAKDSTTQAWMNVAPTKFIWNGETCYGYSERTIAV